MNQGKLPRSASQQSDSAAPVRRRVPTRVAGIVDSVLTQKKLSNRVAETRVFQVFMDLCGEATRKHARPMRLKSGELTIAVDSASWRQQLQLMADDLRKKVNTRLGRAEIASLRFIHGTPSADAFAPLTEEEPLCPLRDAAPQELAEADTLSRLVKDPDLATLIAHAYLGAKRSGRT